MHHGIMEHYPANEQYYDEYMVKDYKDVAQLFAFYGVSLVFTGHFHAQDITKKTFKDSDKFIFDIETGSLVTAPCPFRKVEISKGRRARITSTVIDSIPSMGNDFKAHKKKYVFDGTKVLANTALSGYKVSEDQRELINHQIADAYVAHLRGDEITPLTIIDQKGFGMWLKIVAWMQQDLLEGWWTDIAPEDNNIVIDLNTGKSL